MAYDFEAMKRDGYSDEQISDAIGFDYAKMKSDGYTDEQISNAIDNQSNTLVSNSPDNMTQEQVDSGMVNGTDMIQELLDSNKDTSTNDLGQITVTAKKEDLTSPESRYFNELGNKYQADRQLLEDKKKSILNSNYSEEDKKVFIAKIDSDIAGLKLKLNKDQSDYIAKNKPVPSSKVEQQKENNFIDDITQKINSFREFINSPFEVVSDINAGITEETTRLISPTFKLALHLLEKTSNAIGTTGENIINATVGTDFDFFEQNGEALRKEGDRINKEIDPYNKLGLKPTEVANLTASILATFGITSVPKLMLTEGLLGYAIDFADKNELGNAIATGGANALIAGGSVKIINAISNTFSINGTTKSLEYLWEKNSPELREASGLGINATKEEVIDVIEKRWLKNMANTTSSEANQVRALIDSLDKVGASFKRAVEIVSPTSTEANVRLQKAELVEGLRTASKTDDDVSKVATNITEQVGYKSSKAEDIAQSISSDRDTVKKLSAKLQQGLISEVYGDVSIALKTKYKDTYNIDGDIVSNVKSSLDSKVSKNSSLTTSEINLANALEGELTIDKLLAIKKESTKIAMKSSDNVLKQNASILKDKAEDMLSKIVSKEDYRLLKDMDTEWTNLIRVTDSSKNKLASSLIKFANGKSTQENLIKTLNTMKAGDMDIKEIEKIVGSKNIETLEKQIIHNMLQGKVDDIQWSTISKALDDIGLISSEGKQLKSIINEYNKVFSADNYSILKELNIPKETTDGTALTDDLVAKLRYATASGVWNGFKRLFMDTKKYQDMRAIKNIADILSNKEVTVAGIKLDKETQYNIVRESMFNAYRTQIDNMMEAGKVTDEQINSVVDKGMSRLGFDSKYGGKVTKPTDKGTTTVSSVEERLSPTPKKEQVDKQGGLKISTVDKVTKGTKATDYEKQYLNRFMDDIANPDVSIKNETFDDIYNMVKRDKDIMYAQSDDKKKLWNELFGALSQAKQQGSVKPALRRYIQERIVKYNDMIQKGK